MNDLLPIADLSAELSWIIFATDVTLKVTLVFAAAALITFCLRRKSAALRHRLWSLAVAAGLVIPILAAVMPQWQVPILPAWLAVYFSPAAGSVAEEVLVEPPPPIVVLDEPRTIVEQPQRELPPPRPIDFPPDREIEPVTLPAFHAEPVVISDDATEEPSVRDPLPSSPLPGTILVIWLTGFALCLLRLCAGSLFNALLLSKSRRVTDRQWTQLIDDARRLLGLRRRVRLFVVDRNVIPMTWGIWRPLILLPGSSSEWSESRRRIVLLHELAHVARFDPPLQLMTRLVTALYWFHPLVWLAAYRLQVEREFACDDCVINAGQRATDYAAELVAIAETHRMPRLTSALTMARTSRLEARLRSMFDRARSHQPLRRRVAVLLVVVSGVVASSLAMMQPVSRGEGKTNKEPEPEPNASTEITAPVEKFEKTEANTIAHTIHGRCLEDDEKMVVAGAEVKAYHFPHDEPPVLVAETVTDDEGRFTFENIGRDIARRPGRDRVSILLISTHEKHVTHIRWQTLYDDRPNEFVKKPLRLFMSHEIGSFFGTVRDTAGKTVGGARVFVRSKYGSGVSERFATHFDTRINNAITDENGRYAIDNLRRNMVYTTTVTFPATENIDADVTYPPTSTIVEDQGIPREFDISLPPPGFIEGRVLDAETEMPIGDVVVKANGKSGFMHQESRSDPEGRFRLSLGADNYTVWAESEDRLALKREPVVLEQGETEWNIDINMVTPVTVTGTIRDANGEPHNFADLASGYSVYVRGSAHLWVNKPLNADGTYSIDVAPGKNLFDVGGHASVYTTVPAGEPFHLDIVWGNVEGWKTYHRDLGAELNAMIDRSRDAARKRKASLSIAQATPSVKAGNEQQKARDVVESGIAYLLAQQNDDGTWTAKENFTVGRTALCTLALLEAGVAKDHVQIVKALDYLAAQKPDKTYEVATQTLAFCAADAKKYRPQIQRNVDWLQDAQLDTGTWTYGSPKIGDGDASNAEFAIWALDEAAYAGFEIRQDTWKKSRKYFIKSQLPGGSWGYMPQAKAGTGSMTCAGIASLCICLDHLDDEKDHEYEQAVKAVEHGFLWLREHYAVKHNPGNPNWLMNYLILLRRIGELTGFTDLGGNRNSEYDVREFLVEHASEKDGSWMDQTGSQLATAFALLTLKDRSVRESIHKHQRARGKAGRVVDEQGEPLKNGSIWAISKLGGSRFQTSVVRTNDNGEFEFYYPPKFVEYTWRLAVDKEKRGGSNPEVIEEDPLVLRAPRIRNALLGIWKVVPNENKEFAQMFPPGTEVFITPDRISYWSDLNTDVKVQEEDYHADVFHTPAHIDIVHEENEYPGVFKLDHDRLVLCINRKQKERPTEVMPETDTGKLSVLTLQRIDVKKTVAPFFDFKKISPLEMRIFDALQTPTEIDFNEIPIMDALTFMGEQHGVTVIYDNLGANAAGIDDDVTVTMTLTNVSLHEALEMILRPLKLKYIVEDGAIKVTAAK